MTGDNPVIQHWLLELYNQEIVAEEGTVANEEEWVKGAPDGETRALHESNANLHRQYLAVLRNRRNKVAEGYF